MDSTASCFQGNATRNGERSTLTFTGYNFGGGFWKGSKIFVIPLSEYTSKPLKDVTRFKKDTYINAVECQPSFSRQSIWLSSTALECTLTGDVPFGFVEVVIGVAFQTVLLSQFNLNLSAVCECGTYTDTAFSAFCLPCPPGGSCRGVGDPPRAIQGAWKTSPEEWERVRKYPAGLTQTTPPTNFPLFVPCPDNNLRCLPDNTCSDGSSSWMCTECLPGYEPGDDLTCQVCTTREKTAAYEAVLGTLAALLFLAGLAYLVKVYLFDQWWSPEMKEIVAEEEEQARLEEERREEEERASNLNSAPFGSYIKCMLTYSQTLGALAVYTKALLPDNAKGKTSQVAIQQLLPVYLSQVGAVLDVGFSSHAIRCVITDYVPTYEWRIAVTMAVPCATAFMFYVLYSLYTFGRKLMGGALATKGGQRQEEGVGSGAQPSTRRIFTSLRNLSQRAFPAPSTRPSFYLTYVAWSKEETSTARYFALLLFFFTIPTTITALAAVQDCSPLASGRYLRSNPAKSCLDPDFSRGLQRSSLLFGWGYLFVPVLVGAALYGVAGELEDLTNYKFLVEGYKLNEPLARAWECLITVRKCLFVGLSASFLSFVTDPRIQLVVTMFFLVVFVGVQQHYRPLTSARLNDLDGYALISQLAFCFSVMIRQQGTSGERIFVASTRIPGYVGYNITTAASLETDTGTTGGGGGGGGGGALSRVPTTDVLIFDFISAALAARFIALWVFYLADDKVGKGSWERKVKGWWGAVGEACNTLAQRLWANLFPCAACKEGEGRANALYVKRATVRRGWRHVKNPDGRSMFYPPFLGRYAGDMAVDFAEGDSQWTLPPTGLTLSHWCVHIDARTGLATDRWEHFLSGEVREEAPDLDIPTGVGETVEGEWGLQWGNDPMQPPLWRNFVSGEMAEEFPEGGLTRLGWTLTVDPDGAYFWLKVDTLEARWELPQEEVDTARAANYLPPPPPAPTSWCPIAVARGARPEFWVHVVQHQQQGQEQGQGQQQDLPPGTILEVALEPTPDLSYDAPLSYQHPSLSHTIVGGWRWKECPPGPQGFHRCFQWAHVVHDDPPLAAMMALIATLPPASSLLPPHLNVWFQCKGEWQQHQHQQMGSSGSLALAAGLIFWCNVATGATVLGHLPLGATSLSGWKCAESTSGNANAAATNALGEIEEKGGDGLTMYVHVQTGQIRTSLPDPETTEHFLWPTFPREPWEWCPWEADESSPPSSGTPSNDSPTTTSSGTSSGGGSWVRRAGLGYNTALNCPSSESIPVGHFTVGGWRHVDHPLDPNAPTLWVHPLLRVIKMHPSGAPSPEEEAAGQMAPLPTPGGIWRQYEGGGGGGGGGAHPFPSMDKDNHFNRNSMPSSPSSTSLLPKYWKQDGSGAVSHVLPPQAILPAGWVFTPPRAEATAAGGDAAEGCFVNTFTGSTSHCVPPPCLQSFAERPVWRFSPGLNLWWQEGEGGGRAESLTEHHPLPGGWFLVPMYEKGGDGEGSAAVSESWVPLQEGGMNNPLAPAPTPLFFVHAERKEVVRMGANGIGHTPSDLVCEPLFLPTPKNSLAHKGQWRRVCINSLWVWEEEESGRREFEPPQGAFLEGGQWMFNKGAFENIHTGRLKYSWD